MKRVIVEVEQDEEAEFVVHMIDRLLGENPNMEGINFQTYVEGKSLENRESSE